VALTQLAHWQHLLLLLPHWDRPAVLPQVSQLHF
jgi:hypothetical protein